MAPEDAPATKPDIREFAQRSEDSLLARLDDVKTEVLKAMRTYYEQRSARHAALEARLSASEECLAIVEGRLSEIEKKLLLDPPAA